MVKVTKQTLDALKQLEARVSQTKVVGEGSATTTIYGAEYAALIAAIVALSS